MYITIITLECKPKTPTSTKNGAVVKTHLDPMTSLSTTEILTNITITGIKKIAQAEASHQVASSPRNISASRSFLLRVQTGMSRRVEGGTKDTRIIRTVQPSSPHSIVREAICANTNNTIEIGTRISTRRVTTTMDNGCTRRPIHSTP